MVSHVRCHFFFFLKCDILRKRKIMKNFPSVSFFGIVAILFFALPSHSAFATSMTKAQCEAIPAHCQEKTLLGDGCNNTTQQHVGDCPYLAGKYYGCCRDNSAFPAETKEQCEDDGYYAAVRGSSECAIDLNVRISNISGADFTCCQYAPTTSPTTTSTSSVSTGFSYQPLEPIPGATNASSFPDYVKAIYKFGLWTVGLAALLMLTVGGFLYVTSAGNTSALGNAKGIIKDSLIGIALALTAYLILNIISPDLVNVNLGSFNGVGNRLPETIASVAELPVETRGNVYEGGDALAVLNANGIYVNSSSRCAPGEADCFNYTGNNTGCGTQKIGHCTSLEGIPKLAVNQLINLKIYATIWAKKNGYPEGCTFNVTGGTEVGHKSHGPGLPVFDVTEKECLGKFLASEVTIPRYGVTKVCTRQLGGFNTDAALRCTYVETEPHYHIVF